MDSNHDGDLQMLTADQLKHEVMRLRQSLKASESRRDGVPARKGDGVPARKGDELRQLVYQLRQELEAAQVPLPEVTNSDHMSAIYKLINEYWAIVGPDEHYLAAKRALFALADAPQLTPDVGEEDRG